MADARKATAGEQEADGGGAGRLLVQLAGAGAGILLFVYLIGGLVIRARMGALELPADSTVALISRETVVIAGARLLVVSLLVGLVGLAFAWAIDPEFPRSRDGSGPAAPWEVAARLERPPRATSDRRRFRGLYAVM